MNNFKKMLDNHNYAPHQLSKKSGLPKQTISRWVRGEAELRNITAENLIKVADALEISLDQIRKELDL